MTASNVKMGRKLVAASDLSDLPSGVLQDPSTTYVKLDTLVGTDLTGNGQPGVPAKGLWVGTAGTIDGVDAQGNNFTGFPVIVGFNPIMVKEITALHTAANVWGLY
jgi:hypothetical protein